MQAILAFIQIICVWMLFSWARALTLVHSCLLVHVAIPLFSSSSPSFFFFSIAFFPCSNVCLFVIQPSTKQTIASAKNEMCLKFISFIKFYAKTIFYNVESTSLFCSFSQIDVGNVFVIFVGSAAVAVAPLLLLFCINSGPKVGGGENLVFYQTIKLNGEIYERASATEGKSSIISESTRKIDKFFYFSLYSPFFVFAFAPSLCVHVNCV